MGEFITIRRWSLKAGGDEARVIALIRDAIVPAYEAWPECLKLELLKLDEPTSYITTTHWQSRDAHVEFEGEAGSSWREGYRAILERWDELMDFDQEWFGEVVFSQPTA